MAEQIDEAAFAPAAPGVPLAYATPSNDRPMSSFDVTMVWLAWSALVAGTMVVAFYDTEVGVVAGPVFGVLGLILSIRGLATGRLLLALLGVLHVLVLVACFVLINVMHWGPGPATVPLTLIGCGSAIGLGVLSAWLTLGLGLKLVVTKNARPFGP
ncbi:MAG: hypothetical protein QM770_01450 [Tepidisphaeraceae bacterium]